MKLETTAVHAGAEIDEKTGAVAPPIHLSTTYARDEAGQPIGGFTYIRESNPTEVQLEIALAAMEGGEAAIVFGSGLAAAAAMLQALDPESQVLLPDDGYYGVRVLGSEFASRWGLKAEITDLTDLLSVRATARRGVLLWGETPSNPLMRITDIAALHAIASEVDGLLLIDNTFASPLLQRPIDLGADVVLHSTTKYIGGHSDLQGGALVFRSRGALYERVRHVRHSTGGVASPFNSWLALRGLRSLPARMRMHCENAMAVARFLTTHPAVKKVYYPGMEESPGHQIALRQMSAFGGMLSFTCRAGRAAAIATVGRTRLFTRATSLGGVESLIEHRATSEGEGSTAPEDLIRVSVGLEHPDDLIDDLRQALAAAS